MTRKPSKRLIALEKAHEVVEEKIMEEAKKEAATNEKGIIDFGQNGNEMIFTFLNILIL